MRLKVTDELVQKFAEDMAAKMEARRQFLQSTTCKVMIEQMIASGQELDVEDVHYDEWGVRQRFGWANDLYSREEIEMFCETMIDTAYGVDSFISQLDQDNPFSHSYHLKCGLIVFSMHGQGSIYVIIPAATRPDIHEKLLAAKGSDV
ncbi:hypothetical protein D3C80_1029820 [compost metagenome]